MKYLFYFACSCWVLSFIVNSLTFFNIDVGQILPYIWLLHIGVFIVLIPIFIYIKFYTLNDNNENSLSSINLLPYFKNAPNKLLSIVILGFIYAFFSFVFNNNVYVGSPELSGENYILQEHGRFIKSITEAEFHKFKAIELNNFSAFWIAFYGISVLLLQQIVNDENQKS